MDRKSNQSIYDPKYYLLGEEDIDKIIILLKEDIRSLQRRKSTMPIFGWLTGTSGKLDYIESLTEEFSNLVKAMDDRQCLRRLPGRLLTNVLRMSCGLKDFLIFALSPRV